jgi:hypothetical protein
LPYYPDYTPTYLLICPEERCQNLWQGLVFECYAST